MFYAVNSCMFTILANIVLQHSSRCCKKKKEKKKIRVGLDYKVNIKYKIFCFDFIHIAIACLISYNILRLG